MELGKLMFTIKNKSVPETLTIRYNTKTRNIPNLEKHKTQIILFNKNFLTKAYSKWASLNMDTKTSKSVNEFRFRCKRSVLSNYSGVDPVLKISFI